jgi:N-acetylneuraminic acid mutarotase
VKFLIVILFSVNLLSAQTWSQLADLPGVERDDGVAAVVSNTAYFGTGNRTGIGLGTDFYSYNLVTNTWSTIASMPVGSERQYSCAFTYSNYFFVYGGFGNANFIHNDMYRYDVSANTWSLMATKPGSGVIGACSFTLGDRAYVFCGRYGNDAQVSDEVWEYNMATNVWTQKSNFPFGGRWRGSAAVIGNTPYVIFGRDANSSIRKEIYKYNGSTDSWTLLGNFNQAKRYYVGMQAVNNKLVMVGGADSLNNIFNECWFYDEVNGFVQGPSLPAAARKGGMTAAYQNKFYYNCGYTSTGHSKQTWMLDIPVGIEEHQKENKFSVYPNPIKDFIYINSTENNNYKIEIINLSGQIILEKEMIGAGALDLSEIKNGMYFLKIISENHYTEIKKIIRE